MSPRNKGSLERAGIVRKDGKLSQGASECRTRREIRRQATDLFSYTKVHRRVLRGHMKADLWMQQSIESEAPTRRSSQWSKVMWKRMMGSQHNPDLVKVCGAHGRDQVSMKSPQMYRCELLPNPKTIIKLCSLTRSTMKGMNRVRQASISARKDTLTLIPPM